MISSSHSLATKTVGEIAATVAGATSVFRKYKIDFCCGGNVSLAQALAERGVHHDVLMNDLALLEGQTSQAPSETLDLIKYIVSRYHETHRRELPELVKLARRVEAVHKGHPQVPAGLADVLADTEASLLSHMAKEEGVLFPFMQQGFVPPGPTSMMRMEHDVEAKHIRSMQQLTHGYTLPEEACNTWRALYTGVEKFVTDLTEHIHLENNILFPRFEPKA